MKKRILGIALAICMMIFCVPMGVFAAEAPSFSGGTGTQGDPWLIASQADLTALAEFLNSGNAATFDTENAGVGNCHGYYFKQTADIDLTGVTWEPIGYSGKYYFAGNYDGGGHSITNAVSTGKVDPDGYATAGIFGWAAFGSVENLHVKNANFVATGQNNYSYVGGIAGVCYGSSIKNCSVENSSLESRRNNNNNCAGSIVGYSTGGTFEKCAAENNQIRTMAYGGGFVGEVDDDPNYGAGNSTFTNCYVANCTVISETDDSQGTSFSGGFAGEITDSTLTIQNCYVYLATLSTVGNAVPQGTSVFAGNLWGSSTIADTNCFFGACGITENAGTAGEKTEEDFTNGTVAGLLGDAFAQARNYPRFKDNPADYSAVDAAIAKANALEKDNYKDFSAVEAAINTVVRDKNITEQGEVDAMAQAIENAITALQYKDADYTKVDEAIAKAIEDAMAALVEKPTEAPTATPTATPTAAPSASPTAVPTATPTATPTAAPSASPTAAPTATPTVKPTATPTAAPSASPTAVPTVTPTAAPSASPTAAPTATPTVKPTATPSASPTAAPTATPTAKPTATPTPAPKADPNNPKTGSSNLPVVFGSAALVLSGGALAAVLIYKKKRHEK
ncbi:hypothetical protein [Hominenteromicrobium sp.]|uniref:hypothetical protein n=1 Tax=Hominenteromicrobium sp. TaxID=3073581 RepID=UPI003AF1797D